MGVFRRRQYADEAVNVVADGIDGIVSEAELQALQRAWPLWRRLPSELREEIAADVPRFIARYRWEAARDFEISRDMQVLIAAQACLLVAYLDIDEFRRIGPIIVHPTAVVISGDRPVGPYGLRTDDISRLDGQAKVGGPLVLAWDAVRRDARLAARRNVVFHEFAHALDMVDHLLDGTPRFADKQRRSRWVAVCTTAFEQLLHSPEPTILRDYATTNPAEFFAVATETLFTDPHRLQAEFPDLVDVLVDFFGQDPRQYHPVPQPPAIEERLLP